MGEHSITHAKASVMLYDNERKQWQHSGGSPGLSRVNIYHHPVNNTFRIVGRKLDDHAVVINCALARGLKYNEATPTFHQWRDQRQVYGLNFQSSDDALRFGQEVRRALETLKEAPAQSYQPPRDQYHQETVSNGPSHEDIMRQQRQNADYDSHDNYSSRTRVPSASGQYRQYDSQMSGGESESPTSSQISVVSSITQPTPAPTSAPQAPTPPPAPPAAPPAPAAPPVPAAPAPPQPPPVPGIGGPPAPPPPPPAPSGGGGSLADQIAAAKLRKSSRGDSGGGAASDGGGMRTERSGSRSNNAGGGVGGMDMMAEMQRKLAARRAKAEDKPVSNGPVVKQEEERSFPAVRPAPTSSSPTPPPFSSNKTNFGSQNQSNKTSTSRFTSSSSKSDVTLSSDQLEEFKTELLSAFRQELENYKEEIIQAVRQELSKSL